MRTSWEFFSTEQIVFGNGSIQRLREILPKLKAKNVLIITDKGIKNAGILDKVLNVLHEDDYKVVVYDQAVPEPPISSAVEAYEVAKLKMDTDVIIGLGGGSSIDLAKIVALLMEHGGHPRDYFGSENLVPGPIAPLIAIPTTAGTGSEVTSVAVLTDVENDIKVGISDNYLRPKIALLDSELTLGLPAYVTACSGIDALSHAIEAYTAKSYSYIESKGNILFQGSIPLSDTVALRAIELIVSNLVLAVQQGSNVQARENMLLGSLLAGMAFSNAGTALAHALAYPIGGKVKSPHGELTGLLLPYVMSYNSGVEQDKMKDIARAFGVKTDLLTNEEAAKSAVAAVTTLIEKIGLPTKLSQVGIEEGAIEEIAEKSITIERLVRNNPRVPTEDSLVHLLKSAL
jgi:alcohol dehydrogenase class IV